MKKVITGALVLLPGVAFAQLPTVGDPSLTKVDTLVESIQNLVDVALPIVVGLALLGFFWGLMKFIFNADNDEKKEEGKNIMIYGVVALFVMVAVWGLVNFIASNLGIGTGGSAPVPGVTGI
jgi:hypothetical protein